MFLWLFWTLKKIIKMQDKLVRCCFSGCEKEIIKESKVGCCSDHEDGLIEYYEEEYRRNQDELYRDWQKSQ
jgi:hypothetical protein